MQNIFNLGKVAEIRTGHSFKGKVPASEDGDIKVLQPKDIQDGFLQNSCDLVREEKVANWYAQRLMKDDLLLSNKGTSFSSYLHSDSTEKAIASSSFFVIQTQSKLLPGYLKWYLAQPQALNFLQQHLTGSTVRSLSKRSLVELPLPVPAIAIQKRIEELSQKVEQERITIMELIQHRKQLMNSYAWEQIEQFV